MKMRYTEIDLQIEDIMWFGIDRNGFVFSCTTAGIGNVPEFVCRSKEETEKLYDFFSAKLSDKADYSLNVKKEDNDLINEAIKKKKKGVFCFDAVVDDNHYGDIAFGTKNKFVPSSRRFKGAERWLLFSINPLGDPEMPIYTQTPYRFNNVQVSYINDSLYVNTNDNHCSICIMSDEDWGDSYYAVYKDTCEIKISVPFGKYSICVTKPNYIPYCTSLINTVYIQNENLTGNQTYLGGTIQVGSDVTPYQATGPVIIENGKTQMKALQEVFIKNNFEVQQGAELWIGPLTNP